MKTIDSLKRGIAKARRLWRDGRRDLALTEVQRLLTEWPDNTRLLVMRAQLTQLQDDADGVPTLDDAKNDLQKASELDDQSPAALIELGYLCYAVEDDSKAASRHFKKALNLCVDLLTQALVGHAGALADLDEKSKALNSLMEACSLVANYPDSVRDDVKSRLKGLLEDTLEAPAVSTNGSH